MELNVGVIGCGNISRFHFAALEKIGAKVSWVCDLNEAAAQPYVARFGARYTKDYKQILADPAVTLIDVITIAPLHKPICLAAIAAGKAVICEKTLAENAADALEIVQAATKKNTIFYTSYMKRFIPAVQKAKELLPDLGIIISTHIRAHQCWGDLWTAMPTSGGAYTPPGGKSEVRAKYGGGILVCGGSHILDLVCFLLGRPKSVAADVYTPAGRDYDLRATAMLQTDNGMVNYETIVHPLGKTGYLRDGWDEQIEILGTKGRLHIYSANWTDVDFKASKLYHEDLEKGTVTEYCLGPLSPFLPAITSFCDSVRAGKQGPQARTTGYDVDLLIETMFQSSRERRTLDLQYAL